MTTTAVNLNHYLERPGDLLSRPRSESDGFSRRDIESFQLAAARRKLERHADRIPAVRRLLKNRNPSTFDCFEDFASILYDENAYKSYDLAWIENRQFDRLTHWLDGFTTHDLSSVTLDDCSSLTDWCGRINEQADTFVCHSSGTSGVLSFVPAHDATATWPWTTWRGTASRCFCRSSATT